MTGALFPSRSRFRPVFAAPIAAAGLIVLLYFAGDIVGAIFARAQGLLFADVRDNLRVYHGAVLIGVSATWAIARVSPYHPMWETNYSEWLATTPWNTRRSLPLGPVHLVWEDLLFVTVCSALAVDVKIAAIWPGAIFCAAYTVSLLVPAFFTVPLLVRYSMGFGWAAALFFWPNQLAVVAIILLLCLVSQIGLQHTLKKFPWQTRALAEEARLKKQRTTGDWRMGPLPPLNPIPLSHGLLVSMLIGVWIVAATSQMDGLATWNHDNEAILVIGIFAGCSIAMMRWAQYCGAFHPPISTWGRIWTGRLIIPGYDYVLLAPLCTAAAGGVAPFIFKYLGANPSLTLGLSASAILACAINLPPTVRHWQLTGHHKIAVGKTIARPARNQQSVEF